jgi:hypothetical protein
VSEVTERVGEAEVLLGDTVVAKGSYSLVIEPPALDARRPHEGRRRARGTLRLEDGHTAHKAMAAPAVRVRLDRSVEVTVEVHLYVPGAAFVAFTCADGAVLDQLTQRPAITQ